MAVLRCDGGPSHSRVAFSPPRSLRIGRAPTGLDGSRYDRLKPGGKAPSSRAISGGWIVSCINPEGVLYTPLGTSLGYFGHNGYSESWNDIGYWTLLGYPTGCRVWSASLLAGKRVHLRCGWRLRLAAVSSKPAPTPPPATRRQAQAAQTRQDILAAAQRLFLERGYAGTTLAAIAKAAGWSSRPSTGPMAARPSCSRPWSGPRWPAAPTALRSRSSSVPPSPP
jgi:hypothetical protein